MQTESVVNIKGCYGQLSTDLKRLRMCHVTFDDTAYLQSTLP